MDINQEIANAICDHRIDEYDYKILDFDGTEYTFTPKDCTPEQIAVYFDTSESGALKEGDKAAFDLELLRSRVGWIEKSAVHGEFDGVKWQQNIWAAAEAPVEKVSYRRDDYDELVAIPIMKDFCGTAGCLAGGIAIELGDVHWYSSEDMVRDGKQEFSASSVTDRETGKTHGISEFAQMKLGITTCESDLLFAATNSDEDMVRIGEGLAHRRGLRL